MFEKARIWQNFSLLASTEYRNVKIFNHGIYECFLIKWKLRLNTAMFFLCIWKATNVNIEKYCFIENHSPLPI